MQQGVRAVEAYRRTLLVDGVTSDSETIAPVYKLEELCTLMRTSSLDIVRELLNRILKRLDHRSPVVKQKTLRLIKFAAGKAGTEFRREIQRQAAVIRDLLHYRGQPDALKGDALNKAVRDRAQEAISAIFSSDEKIQAMEEAGRRIQGFGSTNYDMPSRDEKKTMMDEMLGFGSSTIRQMSGLGSNVSSSGYGSSNSGSYRGPNLRRSLTSERESKYDSSDLQASTNSSSAREVFDIHSSKMDFSGGIAESGRVPASQEERLLDSVTTPGGVRLQPSRETVQNFLAGAVNLDAEKLVYAFENKLSAHSWQVRLKAMCILEALLRQGDSSDVFQNVARMFEEDCRSIVDCTKSPQASLREKSKKVLDLLGMGSSEEDQHQAAPDSVSTPPPAPVVLPDLMDGWDASENPDMPQSAAAPLGQDNLVNVDGEVAADSADWLGSSQRSDDIMKFATTSKVADPFAGLSMDTSGAPITGDQDFLTGLETSIPNGTEDTGSLFEGLTVGGEDPTITRKPQASLDSLVDLFGGVSTETPVRSSGASVDPFVSLSSGVSTPQSANGMIMSNVAQPFASGSVMNQAFGPGKVDLSQSGLLGGGGGLPPHMMYMNPAVLMQMVNMLPQGLPPAGLGLGGMSPMLAQQQLAASLANIQRMGMGVNLGTGGGFQGNGAPATNLGQVYTDGFNFASSAAPNYSMEAKKEDTKAFDFLKDHISAQRKGS